MRQFERLSILDPIILLPEQWSRLKSYVRDVRLFSKLEPDEILRRLDDEMERDPRPMCWTQLAQEEVTKEELKRRLQGADAAITCWTAIPDGVLSANAQLRYIGLWTNLFQHRLNIELARERGIHVTCLPDYGTESVAEMTIAGILAVSRKLLKNAKDTQRGKWPYELLKSGNHVPAANAIPQRMLKDKLLGLVGFGRIGQRVAELALAFKMKVQYFSRARKPDWEERGIKYVDLDDLFSSSDVVSVHLSPNAPEKIVSRDLIGRLKTGSIFVNTSAGRLVDQEALFQQLENRRIFAFLDVYEGLPPRHRFKSISLVDNLFTYRAGWFTQEAVTYKGEMLLNQIESYLSGKPGPAVWEETVASEAPSEVPCLSSGPRHD